MPKEIDFKIVYDGGSASDGFLDVYNAAVSARGLSRSLAITVHAFLNDGEIRRRAERANGAKIFISAPRHGSFEEVVRVAIADPFVLGIGGSIIGNAFYDFLKWTWSAATGRESEPTTPFVRRLADRKEPFIGEIATILETPMQELHRPIEGDRDITIDMVRPRVGSILQLDADTLAYVSTRSDTEVAEDVIGNVTRYNVLSGFGRFFSDEENRTVSFDLGEDVSAEEKALLTWSLHERSQGNDGKIYLDVTRVVNARGELNRFKVLAVRRPAPVP
ncbi:DUF7946 domain-containing protein [Luteimonas sp. A534]